MNVSEDDVLAGRILLDSCATEHLSGKAGPLTEILPTQLPPMQMTNGDPIYIEGIGRIPIGADTGETGAVCSSI